MSEDLGKMSKKKDAPEIRFPGFTDAWEQRELGEVLEEKREKTTTENEDVLLSCAIDGMFLNSELFSHFRGQSNIGYLKVKKNDLILSAQNLHLGNCNVNLRFEHGIISPAYKVYELINCDPTFMQAWVKMDSTKAFFDRASTEGASVCRKNIIWTDLYRQELAIPSIAEQKKIGSFFSHLDHLITLHQRKLDKLHKYKKAMLQKMFPQNGADVPEIRFPGFTDAWEQREVKELCSISTGKSNTQDKIDDGQYPFYVRSPIIEKSNKYLYDEEAVITVGDGVGTGKVFHYVNGKYDLHQRCYRMYGFSDELNARYFYHTFSHLFYKRVMAMTAKTSVDSVRLEMISDMKIPTPKVEEQEKIGAYFTNLDHLITLHQRKCEMLQKYKKAMLQKMFV